MYLEAGLLIEHSHLAQTGLGGDKTSLPSLRLELLFSLGHAGTAMGRDIPPGMGIYIFLSIYRSAAAAARAPSPTAVVSCRNPFSLTSPAAKMPATEVTQS